MDIINILNICWKSTPLSKVDSGTAGSQNNKQPDHIIMIWRQQAEGHTIASTMYGERFDWTSWAVVTWKFTVFISPWFFPNHSYK
jgi:hypothetical protein